MMRIMSRRLADQVQWPLFGLLLLGTLLRFYQIQAKTIWLDEAFSIWLAHQGLIDLWAWLIKIDQHPPLYYSLLHFWQLRFGDLQGVVRIFSALCSTLALPFFYGAGRRFFDQPTALVATLILALAPFHIRYAQEARMYALLTLTVALALYLLARLLQEPVERQPRWLWPLFAFAQSAVMLTHNTAAVFFPLALNLAIGGAVAWQFWRGGGSALTALNRPGFGRLWLRIQLLAGLGWLPWSIPFLIQSVGVDRAFWIEFPSARTIYETFHTFHLAHQPDQPIPWLVGDLCYWSLALIGSWSLRRRGALLLLMLSLFLTPVLGEGLVSLRRPIFSDRTLIWVTLPYFLLVAAGVVQVGRWAQRGGQRWLARALPAFLLLGLVALNGQALTNYYRHFEKEGWGAAAAYVAAHSEPGDLLLFNATWVQLPFDYYFRHYDKEVDRHGLPVDLFDRGVLEPKMTTADLPTLQHLLTNRTRVWLIYSHDWYTDPQGLIPRELRQRLRLVDQQQFTGLQVMRFE